MTAYQEKIKRILAGETVLTKEDHNQVDRMFILAGIDRNNGLIPTADAPAVDVHNNVVRTKGVHTVSTYMTKLCQKINCYAARYLETKSESTYNTMIGWIKELKATGYAARYNNMGRKGKLNWPETLKLEEPVFL